MPDANTYIQTYIQGIPIPRRDVFSLCEYYSVIADMTRCTMKQCQHNIVSVKSHCNIDLRRSSSYDTHVTWNRLLACK